DIGDEAGGAQRADSHGAVAREELGAAQSFLAIGGDDLDAPDAAAIVIAAAPRVLAEKQRRAALVRPRAVGQRVEYDLDATPGAGAGIHRHQPEPEQAAQFAHEAVIRRGALAALCGAA